MGWGPKKLMPETKRVTILQIFSPSNAQEDKNSFLRRAQIPYDYKTGLQIRNFGVFFHKKSLERGDFQKPKTDMKQMNCYKRFNI